MVIKKLKQTALEIAATKIPHYILDVNNYSTIVIEDGVIKVGFLVASWGSENMEYIEVSQQEIDDYLGNVEPSEDKLVSVRLGDILNNNRVGVFGEYCDKYGMNPYAINEGRADLDTVVEIELSDAQNWELL